MASRLCWREPGLSSIRHHGIKVDVFQANAMLVKHQGIILNILPPLAILPDSKISRNNCHASSTVKIAGRIIQGYIICHPSFIQNEIPTMWDSNISDGSFGIEITKDVF